MLNKEIIDILTTNLQKKEDNENTQHKMEELVRQMLQLIGEDPTRKGIEETPKRVAKMYMDIFRNVSKTDEQIAEELLKTFEPDGDVTKFGNIVIVKDIPFYSMCEHHLAPFFGVAHVGYIPSKTDTKVIGISKMARLVEEISKRPQIQERITETVMELLTKMLHPEGVMVVLKARHMCMEMRGVKKTGAETVTSAVWGVFKDDPASRNEFLQLIKE